MTPRKLQRDFLILTLLNTLSSSFIWGINTLFLLDAGLSRTEAFGANAFFTVGMVLCDIPTGVLADTAGRRFSYLLGTATLAAATLVYYLLWRWRAPFWPWAADSMLLGLGFTFFNGATEAWVVDALHSLNFAGELGDVFARAQAVSGAAMFIGATAGGIVAQRTNLGVPYLIRCAMQLVSMGAAFKMMHDLGFAPRRMGNIPAEVRAVIATSVEGGLKVPAVRWVMLMNPVLSGVGIYAFYAAQPRLLELYGNSRDYSVAGIAAALVALSQILGGMSAPLVRRFFKRSTSFFAFVVVGSSLFLCLFGLVRDLWSGIVVLSAWGLLGAAMTPLRLSYLNKCIGSKGRATILSFDSALGSAGGAVAQPLLGKSADVWSFAASFVIGGALQLLALPFVRLARRENSRADAITA